jgi:hypothetical protein
LAFAANAEEEAGWPRNADWIYRLPDERSVGAGLVLVEDSGCSATAGIR